MYNKIIVTEMTEEAKKPQNKSKGKNLTPTAILWHYSVIIMAKIREKWPNDHCGPSLIIIFKLQVDPTRGILSLFNHLKM